MIVALLLKKFEPTTGKSKHVLEVARRLTDKGVNFHLITNEVRWNGPASALGHLTIHRLGGSQNALYFKSGSIKKTIATIKPDLLELHGGLSMTLFAGRIARHSPVPVVINIHSQPTDFLKEWCNLSFTDWLHDRKYIADVDDLVGLGIKPIGWRRFVKNKNIKAVIVPSRQLAGEYRGISGIYYIPSGADIRSETGFNDDHDSQNKTILFFGRAVMVRGIDNLITGFNNLAGRYPGINLELLLLNDTDLTRIKRLAGQSIYAERINLLVGRQENMNERIAQAAMAVFPFRCSGCIPEQPLTLIEAMAAGRPVITTPVGTIPEIVQDNVNGLLVPPASSISLTRAMDRLLSDSGLRHRLGRAAAETVRQRYNWQTVAEKTLKVYEQALAIGRK